MPQFTINREPIGDLTVNTGSVIDITSATTGSFFVGKTEVQAASPDSDTTATTFAPRFAGGSGRNLFIKNSPNSTIPYGWMKQFTNQTWSSEDISSRDDVPFNLTINASTGVVEFRDSSNVIFTAPAGSIPIYGRIACNASQENGGVGGGEFIVDLGAATGVVTLYYEANPIPDTFKVEYNGSVVINTGSVSGSGTASFTKTTASPTWAKVIVEAPLAGTAWDFTLSCPGGASPPYITPSGRNTFTGTSTAYGDSLNTGGLPFTVQVVYEGGSVYTELSAYSDVMSFPTEMTEVSSQKWTDGTYNVVISDSGIATLTDYGSVIAQRVESKLIDPSGIYIATTYGKDTFNSGEDFSVVIQLNAASPLPVYTFIALDLAAGSVTGVRGPFSEPTLPANTSTVKYIPLSYCDSDGIIQQIHEGTLLWK